MESLRESAAAGWTLLVRINGEWEHCQVPNSREAALTLKAIRHDYADAAAILIRPAQRTTPGRYGNPPWIN